VIVILLYLVFRSVAEALILIFPTIYAMSGGLLLQWLLKYNFIVAVAVGYIIALFGIAVETGVVMVVYLHEALEHRLKSGKLLTNADIEAAAVEGAVQRLRPKLMTVCAVLASLVPILWESGIGSDVMKPIAAYRWRHDHLDHSCPHPGACFLRHDEGTGRRGSLTRLSGRSHWSHLNRRRVRMLAAIGHALMMSFAMTWEILWALILGFGLSAIIQAVVSKEEMSRLRPTTRLAL
jgi:hypothetical protein